jgi:hypothetical protein
MYGPDSKVRVFSDSMSGTVEVISTYWRGGGQYQKKGGVSNTPPNINLVATGTRCAFVTSPSRGTPKGPLLFPLLRHLHLQALTFAHPDVRSIACTDDTCLIAMSDPASPTGLRNESPVDYVPGGLDVASKIWGFFSTQ